MERFFDEKNPIAITAKALVLEYSQQKLLIDSRLISDIRPLFQKDIDEGINYSIMVHNLKVEYQDGDEIKYLYLGLDLKDINKLKENAIRAERKIKIIKNKIESDNHKIIEINKK